MRIIIIFIVMIDKLKYKLIKIKDTKDDYKELKTN